MNRKANLQLVPKEEARTMPILTVFYADYKATQVVRRIRAGDPLRAMQLCLGHMRRNTYGAVLAEVYDTAIGRGSQLYGVMKRSMDGQVKPLFHFKEKDEKNHGN